MAVYAGPEIVTDGLVLSLDAGNSRSYPSTGTAWNDLSGRGNSVILTNGPTYNSANGGAIVFDGSDDHALASGRTTVTEFQYNSAFAVSCWCRVEENTNTGYIVNNRFTDAGNAPFCGWGVCQSNGSILAFVGGYPSNQFAWRQAVSSSTTFNNLVYNKWANITYLNTGNAGEQKIYINGTDVTTSAYDDRSPPHTINYSNGNSRICVGRDGTVNHPLTGKIAQVLIYNRALSASEVAQNYAATRGRFGL